MMGFNLLTALGMLVCLVIACFYLLRLINNRRWLRHFDVENEIGHGIMAVGMVYMLAPTNLFPPDILDWSILLFALASFWWLLRLCVHRPILAIVLGRSEERSPISSDAIHVITYVGMCLMFVLMRSMAFSMTSLAISLIRIFFALFAVLTVFYGREVFRELRAVKVDWLTLSANIAHVLMNGIMCWMFFEMVSMSMTMGVH